MTLQQTDLSSQIVLFRLTNSSGAYVELVNYGATLVSVVVPDKNGVLENCILRYDRIEDYFSDPFYLGSTVGRFANRISGAKFNLNGKTYFLDKNDGQNCNHGGFSGFNKEIFNYEITEDGINFFLESKESNHGFPGKLLFSTHYSFSENNELSIRYQVISDKDTIFNPTNHAYFNLSQEKGSIMEHELKIFGEQYLQMNEEFLPTGKILKMERSAFDFREYQAIGLMAKSKNEIIPGYNSFFIGNNKQDNTGGIALLASLRETQSGRTVNIYSSMPGIQIYTGDYLSSPFKPHQGICLEAQFHPDSPNHSHFPDTAIQAGKEYVQKIIYQFF